MTNTSFIYLFKSATLFNTVLILFIYIHIFYYIYFKTLVFVLLYTYIFLCRLIVICCEAPRMIMDVALYKINIIIIIRTIYSALVALQ